MSEAQSFLVSGDTEPVNPPASVEWSKYDAQSAGVVIVAQGVGEIEGTLTDTGDPKNRLLYVDMFTADKPGNGSGKRLLELLTAEGRKYGASILGGHFTSPAALGAFLRTVSEGSVTFMNRYSGEIREITLEEAFQHPGYYKAFGSIAVSLNEE